MRLDHVALATRDALPVLDTLVGDLGGTVLQGAEQAGIRPIQVRVGDAERGMTVELLEPFRTDEADFLERFLRDRGEGPHHLTFKVPDLVAEVARLEAAGLHPVGVLLDSPRWKEAFLTPSEAHGTVVQFAQGGLEFPSFAAQFASARVDGPYGEPRWWPDPPPRASEASYVECVVVSTPALPATTAFYADVCGGAVTESTPDAVRLEWPGGAVRLVEDASRPPGILRLDAVGPGPARELVLAGTPVLIRPA